MSENGSDHWMDEAVRSSHRRGYHRPSDAWECGVSSKDCRCATGPTSDGTCPSSVCRPVHRLHWWRRRSRSVITVLAICICSIILATPWHREFLAPGELSKAHSQILHGPLQENRCAACHPAGQLSTLAWLVSPHPSLGTNTDQKSLCIQCHQIDMPIWRCLPSRSYPSADTRITATDIESAQSGQVRQSESRNKLGVA